MQDKDEKLSWEVKWEMLESVDSRWKICSVQFIIKMVK